MESEYPSTVCESAITLSNSGASAKKKDKNKKKRFTEQVISAMKIVKLKLAEDMKQIIFFIKVIFLIDVLVNAPLCLKQIVKEELEKIWAEKKPAAPPSTEVHLNAMCQNCKANPILGVRYKCTQCMDYNLCEKCESQNIHSEHIMLKIKRSEQAPFPSCPPFFPRHCCRGFGNRPRFGQRIRHFFNRCFWGKKNFDYSLLTDRILNLVSTPGEIVQGNWHIQKNIEGAWPIPLVIEKINGIVEFENLLISDQINYSKDLKLCIPIKAPTTIGKYKIALGFLNGARQKICPNLKIHLTVMSNEMKSGMVNNEYFMASQLSAEGFGSFDDCLKVLRESNGSIYKAKLVLTSRK